MKIHVPKHITSSEGLGLNTTKDMKLASETLGIGTETWNELEEPWQESGTIIAKPGYKWVTKWEVGTPYIITKILDENSTLVGIYCDVSRPVKRNGDNFEFEDLYVDVWQVPGSAPVILDEDELEANVEAGNITKEEGETAKAVAKDLVEKLKNDSSVLDF